MEEGSEKTISSIWKDYYGSPKKKILKIKTADNQVLKEGSICYYITPFEISKIDMSSSPKEYTKNNAHIPGLKNLYDCISGKGENSWLGYQATITDYVLDLSKYIYINHKKAVRDQKKLQDNFYKDVVQVKDLMKILKTQDESSYIIHGFEYYLKEDLADLEFIDINK